MSDNEGDESMDGSFVTEPIHGDPSMMIDTFVTFETAETAMDVTMTVTYGPASMSPALSERPRASHHGFSFNPAILATPTKMTPEFGKMCGFLRGTPGKRVSCAIYETRPTICAKYKPGGEGCRMARAELDLPH